MEALSLHLTFVTFLQTFAVFILILFLVHRIRAQKKNQPPGPWGLPFLGHLLFLGKEPWKKFLEWKKDYGNIYMISIAGKRVLVLNDIGTATELFSRYEMLGTLSLPFFEKFIQLRGGGGLAFSEGRPWREVRPFVVKSFAEFGTRSRNFLYSLASERGKLIGHLEETKSKPVSLSHLLAPYTVNATWGAIGNGDLNSREVETLLTGISAESHYKTPLDGIAVMLPGIFEKFTSVLDWRYKAFRDARSMLERKLKVHLEARMPDQPRDIIDKFQDVTDTTTDESSSFHSGNSQLTATVTDILFASVDTTTLTMEWLIFYALKNPEIQGKIQEEVDRVITRDCSPSLDHRNHMPFTESCILETLRIRPVVPIGVPKRIMKDTEYKGFSFPEDTLAIVNIAGLHHDPEIWEQPEEFIPERFIGSDGCLKKDLRKKIYTFGIGKRVCPGERFAYETMFMFVTSIFQNFSITSPVANPCVEAALGFISAPKFPISVTFVPRF